MKATDLITVTLAGKTFQACRHCAAHMERTVKRFKRIFPSATLVIVQGPWNTTVEASAGTHDYCSAFDVWISGLDWLAAQMWLRKQGFAAWYRVKNDTWSDHVHMLSLGCEQRLGIYVPDQLDDYFAHKTGMTGHLPDTDQYGRPTWFPANISKTIFKYVPEDEMAQYAEDLTRIEAKVDKVLAKQYQSWRREQKANDLLRKVLAEVKDAATRADIEALLAEQEASA